LRRSVDDQDFRREDHGGADRPSLRGAPRRRVAGGGLVHAGLCGSNGSSSGAAGLLAALLRETAMLRARAACHGIWLLAVLAAVLLVGCAGTTPTSGPDKATPPAEKKPADKGKDGKSPPPEREVG